MKKIAIISNFNEKCGIAQYSENLLKGFSRLKSDIEVDILKIDTLLVKSRRKNHKKKKRNHWIELANKASGYDAVNIQFENGIFGNNDYEVLDSLKILFSSNKNITITMHTVIYDYVDDGFFDVAKLLIALKFKSALKCLARSIHNSFLEKFMKLVAKNPHVKIIVHTDREQRNLRKMFDYENVFSHPLSFTNEIEREVESKRNEIENNYGFRKDDKIIAIFGFISEYKGHLTAIRALQYLPVEYKLLIVGASHPNSIRAFRSVDKYLSKVIDEIEKLDMIDRVIFAGSVSDEELMDIMRSTDLSVFPYVEVGQSASGPATMKLELGGRALFSNAHVFTELDYFSNGSLERFDIGNYLELSKHIRKSMQKESVKENDFNRQFSLNTLVDFYTRTLIE